MEKLGDLAAFGTALCWTVSALIFERSSRKLGALAVNFYKVFFAFFMLTLFAWAIRGLPFPTDAPASTWLYLSLSGFIGFVIADYFLFNAYIYIGSRVTVIYWALSPLFASVLAFFILGETIAPRKLIGMAAVITGILIVVLTQARSGPDGSKSASPGRQPGTLLRGHVFALLSSFFQAAGLVVSKLGIGDYHPVAANQIRILTAIVGFSIQALLLHQIRAVFVQPLRESKNVRSLFAGAVFGPFLGVSLSLLALQNTGAGSASTLMALSPVLIIPPSILIFKQKVRPMEIVGSCVAVSGVALFFLI